MKTWKPFIPDTPVFTPKSHRVIGMSFPRQDKSLGLEPSILNVLPEGNNIEYDPENRHYNDQEVDLYLCSVYISGLAEFNQWKQHHNKNKIVVGGYHPTTFPEDFPDVYKVVIGPCESLFATLNQEGQVVQGISKRRGSLLPRRDLYNFRELNQQVIPDKNPSDLVLSINTSIGCPMNPPCDFCCTPMMCPTLESKPLDILRSELEDMVRLLNGDHLHFLFIRDENFTAQKDWQYRLNLIHFYFPSTKIYLFGSANTINENAIKFMAEHGVYMICLGLEDVTVKYNKNKKLDTVVETLKKYGIYTYLSFIVNPLKIVGREEGKAFYQLLLNRLFELKPEMVCGNFLMPFRGTKLWDNYYHLISPEDYVHYTSKEPFLIRNEILREKMKFFMFWYQWEYFTSNIYNNEVRTFACYDTLHRRFLELYKEFECKYRKLWNIRP